MAASTDRDGTCRPSGLGPSRFGVLRPVSRWSHSGGSFHDQNKLSGIERWAESVTAAITRHRSPMSRVGRGLGAAGCGMPHSIPNIGPHCVTLTRPAFSASGKIAESDTKPCTLTPNAHGFVSTFSDQEPGRIGQLVPVTPASPKADWPDRRRIVRHGSRRN